MKKLYLFVTLILSLLSSASSQDLTFYGFLPSYSQTGVISNKFDYNFFASVTPSVIPVTYSGIHYPAKLLQVYISQALFINTVRI